MKNSNSDELMHLVTEFKAACDRQLNSNQSFNANFLSALKNGEFEEIFLENIDSQIANLEAALGDPSMKRLADRDTLRIADKYAEVILRSFSRAKFTGIIPAALRNERHARSLSKNGAQNLARLVLIES